MEEMAQFLLPFLEQKDIQTLTWQALFGLFALQTIQEHISSILGEFV